MPGCHEYAMGTSTYDHELCPSCTSKVANVGKSIFDVAKAVGVPILVAVIGRKFKDGKSDNPKSK